MTQNHPPEAHAAPGLEARLSRLEAQLATLAEAVRALAHGLENIPSQDTPPEEAARGARLAHELLLSKGL
ncbi:hypothetical protein SSP35_14_01020 [Streptomyces sp. NBRC 110611]|uniref:hypothetical protein n=1 Tax=Streptomyces sp. NBRC 110611 TaxID=1621259 RepID=UPI0008363A1E|nr:hypothetical protein [Streptomyces sp. NBRC 110611]GAU69768.1 hypothetical protein SSP35_14_01020 [Streptomyces sp. NBRC 110611]